MTYFRLKLVTGVLAGPKPVGSDSDRPCRRHYLLNLYSMEKIPRRDDEIGDASVTTYGVVLHYALEHVDGRPLAFAYVSRVRSARDRDSRSGYAAERFGTGRVSSADGTRYYAPAGAMEAVVGTLERGGVHCVLFNRETFSEQR